MRCSRSGRLLAAVALSSACHGSDPARVDAGAGSSTSDAATIGMDAGSDAGTTSQSSCRDGWCWMYPTPQGNPLLAVGGVSGTDVWTVGRLGAIEHYDGAHWAEYSLPDPSNRLLTRVFAVSADDVWVAGDGLFHWDGHAWTGIDVGGVTVLALGGTDSMNVWIASFGNGISQWNGSTLIPRGGPAITGQVLGYSSYGGSIYAVSSGGGIAKWLGSGWGVIDAGNHTGNAAALISPTQAVLAADGGVVWFFDGNGWTSRMTPQTTAWTSIAAASLDDVWVTDGKQAAHWDGAHWAQAATGAVGATSAAGLWLDPSGELWMTTDRSELYTFTSNTWSARTVGVPDIINVGGTADNDIWVTTLTPPLVTGTRHWDGTSWTDVANPATSVHCFARGLWAAATNDVWVALTCRSDGVSEFVPRRLMHWDGSTWALVGSLGSEDAPIGGGFNDVWGSSANNVYAVADSAVFHFDGSAWSQVMNGPPGGSTVFGLGDNDAYVGHGSELWHWNGAQWTSRTSPVGIVGGLEIAPDSVWLGGNSSGSFFDGQLFVTTSFINQPVGNSNNVFVAEWGGNEVRYDGGIAGTQTTRPAFFSQMDAWRAPSGRTYVVTEAGGAGGLVFREP